MNTKKRPTKKVESDDNSANDVPEVHSDFASKDKKKAKKAEERKVRLSTFVTIFIPVQTSFRRLKTVNMRFPLADKTDKILCQEEKRT